MGNDLVSVIIPTYNREKTILASIDSVLNQTYTNLECIVVDDCSTDNTQDLVRAITDRRLKYIRCDFNVGSSKARNVGINIAAGNYITFNDSDSYWNKDKLEKQINYFGECPECGMVYCRFWYRTPETDRILPSMKYKKTELEGHIYERLLRGNVVDTSAMMIKKEVIIKVGSFAEDIKSIEDYELALRIAYQYKVGFVDEALFENVYSPNGVNSDNENKMNAFIYLIRQNWNKMKGMDKYKLINSFLKLVAGINDYRVQNDMIERLYREINLSSEEREIIQTVFHNLVVELFKKNSLKKLISTIKEIDKYRNMNVLLYGYGEIGQALASLFKEAGIQIKGFIDQDSIWDKKHNILHLKKLPRNIDLIINTLPEWQMQNEEIEKNTSAKVVSIIELF